ncbi:MAG: hypothetical protein IJW44_01695 [Clostridia bacterium]|nr:hypothetical protein [Clostridia bacterium]
MKQFGSSALTVGVDFAHARIESLRIGGTERLCGRVPLFRLRLRNRAGEATVLSATDAASVRETEDGAIYGGFPGELEALSVRVSLGEEQDGVAWRVAVDPGSAQYFVEWVDFPAVNLPPLAENNTKGDGGAVLIPYNEGALVTDLERREQSSFRYTEPEYPSMGSYFLFPNMVSSQMMAYLWEDAGLYVGAHDPRRGVKGLDFYGEGEGVTLRLRLFCGVAFGETFSTDYPILWAATEGRWESAAERYRAWFEGALPTGVRKLRENESLPEWYADNPLVVSYPVRGKHDMDEMVPNRYYPYVNALPELDEIRRATDSRLLVLLMHWEGTAPWAPPYVWPPFGGTEAFQEFGEQLHRRGDLLGVYCSGFGFTEQSNLIASYNCRADYEARGLERGMCAAPDGEVWISKICTGQRSGYDICPASEVGRAILDEAYAPLFENGLDYVQILDQNHGGGQYFCYSREHGHPPAPGPWMTEKMQEMLSDWNRKAGKTLFGCESAAAEPFIGNLLFSDNRFELNYRMGRPVPLYAYLYHEYVRNFMGNQVSCPFRCPEEDTLRYRLAYAFSAGDCMTQVLRHDGELLSHWGQKDFSYAPDREKTLRLIANLTRFYREQAKPYLLDGRMIPTLPTECGSVTYESSMGAVTLPRLLLSAWESPDGSRAQLLVNPEDDAVTCQVDGTPVTVPPLSAILHFII